MPHRTRWLVFASLLAGCATSPIGAPGALAIGTGDRSFAALEAGDDLAAIHGCQGGRHVLVSLRATGLGAGDVVVRLALSRDSSGEALSIPFEIRARARDADGVTEIIGLPLLLDLALLPSAIDQPALVHAEVTDSVARHVAADLRIVLRLGSESCELDPAVGPDAGSPDAAIDAGVAIPIDAGVAIDADAGPPPLLADVTTEVGLAHDPGSPSRTPDCYLDDPLGERPGDYCVPEYFVGGAATGDFDGDGDDDLFVPRLRTASTLYRNDRGRFVDVSAEAGTSAIERAIGAAFADIDGDGDLDLFVTRYAAPGHLLFVNDGRGAFHEEADARGASIAGTTPVFGTTPAFGDYDLDGDVDLYVGEWRLAGLMPGAPRARLLRNTGDGTFSDVTVEAGVSMDLAWIAAATSPGVFVFTPAFVDLDGDRFPELVLVADFGTTRIFHNQRDGRFDDVTEALGIARDLNGMGAAFGDVDGDGRLDVFIAAISNGTGDGATATGNRLYLGRAGLTLEDASDALGVREAGWAWGAALFDRDSDGLLELAVAAGYVGAGHSREPFRIFERHDARAPFVDVAPSLGVDVPGSPRGVAVLDGDDDGDLDLVIGRIGAPLVYLRNDALGGHYLRVRARGVRSGTEALGARVEVVVAPGDAPRVAWIGAGSGYLGQSERVAHFGLGAHASSVAEVRVIWPRDGAITILRDVAVDRVLSLTEPE